MSFVTASTTPTALSGRNLGIVAQPFERQGKAGVRPHGVELCIRDLHGGSGIVERPGLPVDALPDVVDRARCCFGGSRAE